MTAVLAFSALLRVLAGQRAVAPVEEVVCAVRLGVVVWRQVPRAFRMLLVPELTDSRPQPSAVSTPCRTRLTTSMIASATSTGCSW